MTVYIHLNPIRAELAPDIKALDKHPFCGHAVVLGKKKKDWQDDAYVLKLFDNKRSTARRRYKIFVGKGIRKGKRPEFTGGGLIRSSGGWSVIKSLRRADILKIRRGKMNEARNAAIYLTRRLRPDTLKEIGAQFGIVSDSTVSSVMERMKKKLAGDRKFSLRLDKIAGSIIKS